MGPVGPVSVEEVEKTLNKTLRHKGKYRSIIKGNNGELNLVSSEHDISEKDPQINYCIKYRVKEGVNMDSWAQIKSTVFRLSGDSLTQGIVEEVQRELSGKSVKSE